MWRFLSAKLRNQKQSAPFLSSTLKTKVNLKVRKGFANDGIADY